MKKRTRLIPIKAMIMIMALQVQACNASVALNVIKKHPIITTAAILGISTVTVITAHKAYKSYRARQINKTEIVLDKTAPIDINSVVTVNANALLNDFDSVQQMKDKEKKQNHHLLCQNRKEIIPYTKTGYSLPYGYIQPIHYEYEGKNKNFTTTFLNQLDKLLFPDKATPNGSAPQVKIFNNRSCYTTPSLEPQTKNISDFKYQQMTLSTSRVIYSFISAVCSNLKTKFDFRDDNFINSFSYDEKEAKEQEKIYWESDGWSIFSNAREQIQQFGYTKNITDDEMENIKKEALAGAAQVYKIHLQIDYPYLINFLRDFIPFINNNKFGRVIEIIKVSYDKIANQADQTSTLICYLKPLAGTKEENNSFLQKLLQTIATRYKNLPKEAFVNELPRYNKKINDFIYLAQNNGDTKKMYKKILENKYFRGKIENVFTENFAFLKGYEFDQQIK
jgi:hypothetical protein